MDATPQSTDIFQNEKMPPAYGMLKTLTMLTFIGCALAYIFIFVGIADWGNYEKRLVEAQKLEEESRDNEVASKIMQGSAEVIKKSHEHRYVVTATSLIFTTMCLFGAMRMRKLRKSGYPIYVIGELAPLAVSGVLLGFSFFGGIVMAISAVFALLFVILYTTQRKYMIYD